MMVTMVKAYRLNGEYGVQVWFSDGASVRFDGFSSLSDVREYVGKMWGDVHVVVN